MCRSESGDSAPPRSCSRPGRLGGVVLRRLLPPPPRSPIAMASGGAVLAMAMAMAVLRAGQEAVSGAAAAAGVGAVAVRVVVVVGAAAAQRNRLRDVSGARRDAPDTSEASQKPAQLISSSRCVIGSCAAQGAAFRSTRARERKSEPRPPTTRARGVGNENGLDLPGRTD
jgi:hypothetical protein